MAGLMVPVVLNKQMHMVQVAQAGVVGTGTRGRGKVKAKGRAGEKESLQAGEDEKLTWHVDLGHVATLFSHQ